MDGGARLQARNYSAANRGGVVALPVLGERGDAAEQSGVSMSRLDGPLTVGSVFRWRSGRFRIVSTLQVVEPNERIGWTGTAFGMRSRHVWTLTPRENGTLVLTEETLEGWGARLSKVLTPRFLGRTLQALLEALKRRAEGGGT